MMYAPGIDLSDLEFIHVDVYVGVSVGGNVGVKTHVRGVKVGVKTYVRSLKTYVRGVKFLKS